MGRPKRFLKILSVESLSQPCFFEKRFQYSLIRPALHKKSWAVIDRPYSLGCATVGALYERPRCIFCAKPIRPLHNVSARCPNRGGGWWALPATRSFSRRHRPNPARMGKPIRQDENEKTDVPSTGIAFAAVPFFRDWLGAGDRLHHRRGEGCIGGRRAGSGRNRPARGNRDHAHRAN